MIEIGATIALAAVAGLWSLSNKIHSRINTSSDRIKTLDNRISAVELGVAQNYVSKNELAAIISRVESHMVRIENKLDQIVLRNE